MPGCKQEDDTLLYEVDLLAHMKILELIGLINVIIVKIIYKDYVRLMP